MEIEISHRYHVGVSFGSLIPCSVDEKCKAATAHQGSSPRWTWAWSCVEHFRCVSFSVSRSTKVCGVDVGLFDGDNMVTIWWPFARSGKLFCSHSLAHDLAHDLADLFCVLPSSLVSSLDYIWSTDMWLGVVTLYHWWTFHKLLVWM